MLILYHLPARQTTRALAEEQFMKRALAEQILAGIPMREFGMSMRPEWS